MKFRSTLSLVLSMLALLSPDLSASDLAGRYRLAVESLQAGRYGEARAVLESALAGLGERAAAADRALLLDRLGDALGGEGDWPEAERLYRRSLAAWEQAPQPRPLDSALPLADLANVIRRLGRLSEADAHYTQAHDAIVQLAGPSHPELAGLLNQHAQLAQQQGDEKTAATRYRHALRIWEQLGRSHDPDAAYPLHNLGLLEVRAGLLGPGQDKLARADGIWQAALPAGHPVFAASSAALGESAAAQGDADEARRRFDAALAHARVALGPRHVKVGLLLARYSAALRSLGSNKRAKRLAAESERILASHDGSRQAALVVDVSALDRSLR
ncbi:MAG: tetratricopeptide repeat protein [Bryobacterales bacterium]|nr:tetratricopeptide repeat protein [Acidobacteriota bacterium]MCB9383128.1 tetratricopeptide repeat protein [Bryobacterales bacterium]